MNKMYSKSGLLVEAFEKIVDGKQTGLYTLTNNSGSEVTITNYGAKIVSLMVPDKEGILTDVVLGHPSIEEYLTSQEPYFGGSMRPHGKQNCPGSFFIGWQGIQNWQ